MHCGVTFYFLGILAVRHSSPLEYVLSIYEALGSVFIPEYLRKERKREKMEQEQEDKAAAGTRRAYKWRRIRKPSPIPPLQVVVKSPLPQMVMFVWQLLWQGKEVRGTKPQTAQPAQPASGQICLVADVASETQVAFGKYLFRE